MAIRSFTSLSLALLLSASVAPVVAFAQFVWLDNHGVKQYSDRPPPASVPLNRILKSPSNAQSSALGAPATPSIESRSAAASGSLAVARPAAPETTAERNTDYNKRKMEQAEKDKKAQQAALLATEKAANCEKIRAYQRTLEDGTRISSVDKNGERNYLSDEQRSAEIQTNNQQLANCR